MGEYLNCNQAMVWESDDLENWESRVKPRCRNQGRIKFRRPPVFSKLHFREHWRNFRFFVLVPHTDILLVRDDRV